MNQQKSPLQKKIVITGATSGIGWETFKSLWKDGHHLILPVRNLEKGKKMLSEFGAKDRVSLFEMNLSDLKNVQNAANQILSNFEVIDMLINNAGGMFPPKQKTKDGLDETFVVNHLGHFLLTKSLISIISLYTGKVINISSAAHRLAKVDSDDFGLRKSNSSFGSYATAKLYNILFTKGLRDKHTDRAVQCYALHPGAVNTSFGNSSGGIESAIIQLSKLFFISPQKGAQTTLYLANTATGKLTNGGYYDKKKLSSTSSKANNMKLVDKLWAFSEAELKRILG